MKMKERRGALPRGSDSAASSDNETKDSSDDETENKTQKKTRKRILTGDRPTGPLHVGNYVGTLANRVKLQDEYETFLLVADHHMLTTRLDRLSDIQQNIRDDVLDHPAVGV